METPAPSYHALLHRACATNREMAVGNCASEALAVTLVLAMKSSASAGSAAQAVTGWVRWPHQRKHRPVQKMVLGEISKL
jgi:hypothetical protein